MKSGIVLPKKQNTHYKIISIFKGIKGIKAFFSATDVCIADLFLILIPLKSVEKHTNLS